MQRGPSQPDKKPGGHSLRGAWGSFTQPAGGGPPTSPPSSEPPTSGRHAHPQPEHQQAQHTAGAPAGLVRSGSRSGPTAFHSVSAAADDSTESEGDIFPSHRTTVVFAAGEPPSEGPSMEIHKLGVRFAAGNTVIDGFGRLPGLASRTGSTLAGPPPHLPAGLHRLQHPIPQQQQQVKRPGCVEAELVAQLAAGLAGSSGRASSRPGSGSGSALASASASASGAPSWSRTGVQKKPSILKGTPAAVVDEFPARPRRGVVFREGQDEDEPASAAVPAAIIVGVGGRSDDDNDDDDDDDVDDEYDNDGYEDDDSGSGGGAAASSSYGDEDREDHGDDDEEEEDAQSPADDSDASSADAGAGASGRSHPGGSSSHDSMWGHVPRSNVPRSLTQRRQASYTSHGSAHIFGAAGAVNSAGSLAASARRSTRHAAAARVEGCSPGELAGSNTDPDDTDSEPASAAEFIMESGGRHTPIHRTATGEADGSMPSSRTFGGGGLGVLQPVPTLASGGHGGSRRGGALAQSAVEWKQGVRQWKQGAGFDAQQIAPLPPPMPKPILQPPRQPQQQHQQQGQQPCSQQQQRARKERQKQRTLRFDVPVHLEGEDAASDPAAASAVAAAAVSRALAGPRACTPAAIAPQKGWRGAWRKLAAVLGAARPSTPGPARMAAARVEARQPQAEAEAQAEDGLGATEPPGGHIAATTAARHRAHDSRVVNRKRLKTGRKKMSFADADHSLAAIEGKGDGASEDVGNGASGLLHGDDGGGIGGLVKKSSKKVGKQVAFHTEDIAQAAEVAAHQVASQIGKQVTAERGSGLRPATPAVPGMRSGREGAGARASTPGHGLMASATPASLVANAVREAAAAAVQTAAEASAEQHRRRSGLGPRWSPGNIVVPLSPAREDGTSSGAGSISSPQYRFSAPGNSPLHRLTAPTTSPKDRPSDDSGQQRPTLRRNVTIATVLPMGTPAPPPGGPPAPNRMRRNITFAAGVPTEASRDDASPAVTASATTPSSTLSGAAPQPYPPPPVSPTAERAAPRTLQQQHSGRTLLDSLPMRMDPRLPAINSLGGAGPSSSTGGNGPGSAAASEGGESSGKWRTAWNRLKGAISGGSKETSPHGSPSASGRATPHRGSSNTSLASEMGHLGFSEASEPGTPAGLRPRAMDSRRCHRKRMKMERKPSLFVAATRALVEGQQQQQDQQQQLRRHQSGSVERLPRGSNGSQQQQQGVNERLQGGNSINEQQLLSYRQSAPGALDHWASDGRDSGGASPRTSVGGGRGSVGGSEMQFGGVAVPPPPTLPEAERKSRALGFLGMLRLRASMTGSKS